MLRFEVSKVDVSTHLANHIHDHASIAIEVECMFSIESSEERKHVDDRNPTRDDQLECLVDSDDEQSVSVKK